MEKLRGRVLKYGDNVDTDGIIPARYCTSFRETELGAHAMEDVDPEFARKVRPRDILVAGRNFACGSSRENAPLALKGAGIAAVVAKPFSRISYRNAIIIALPLLESEAAASSCREGDEVEINLERGIIYNIVRNLEAKVQPYPALMQEILSLGGMMAFVRKRLAERS